MSDRPEKDPYKGAVGRTSKSARMRGKPNVAGHQRPESHSSRLERLRKIVKGHRPGGRT